MLMYWSAVVILRNRPERAVEETIENVDFIMFANIFVMLLSMPLAVIAPPKHMAQRISHIVFIMPCIPLVATKSLTSWFPVSICVLVVIIAIIPSKTGLEPLPNSSSISCCAHKAAVVARIVETKRVISDGILFAIIKPVRMGTASSQGVMLNFSFSVFEIS